MSCRKGNGSCEGPDHGDPEERISVNSRKSPWMSQHYNRFSLGNVRAKRELKYLESQVPDISPLT